MVNLGKVIKGATFSFLAYVLIFVTNYIVPPIIEAGQTIYTGSVELQQTTWFIVILVWVWAAVIMPLVFITGGLKEKTRNKNQIASIALGATLALITIILFIKAWFMIEAMMTILNGLPLALFWISLIVNFLAIGVITPYYLIVRAQEQ